MLGRAIVHSLMLSDHLLFTPKKDDLNLTDAKQVEHYIKATKPDYLINCAAYTAVDNAEKNKQDAFSINGEAVRKVADICADCGIKLIHFSTDYVFDGENENAYLPQDHTAPINLYGTSKLAGEQAVQDSGAQYLILRISWLYAPWDKNFFNFIRRTKSNTIQIVDSQIGNPTSVLSVADFIRHLIDHNIYQQGIYHFANQGAMSWYAFAKAIKHALNLPLQIRPTANYPTVASRPKNSRLNCSETQNDFNYKIPDQKAALAEVIAWEHH